MFRRADGLTVYSGSHVGTRGSLASIRANGPEDFSEGIPSEDVEWEQMVKSAMITREASFSGRWEGDWQEYDEPDMDVQLLASHLWGVVGYKHTEKMEPPFGRR